MITRHPYRAVGALLGLLAASTFLAGRIGQFNDGPWGGLPSWLGTASYAVTLLSALTLVVLSAWLAVGNVRHRRSAR